MVELLVGDPSPRVAYHVLLILGQLPVVPKRQPIEHVDRAYAEEFRLSLLRNGAFISPLLGFIFRYVVKDPISELECVAADGVKFLKRSFLWCESSGEVVLEVIPEWPDAR